MHTMYILQKSDSIFKLFYQAVIIFYLYNFAKCFTYYKAFLKVLNHPIDIYILLCIPYWYNMMCMIIISLCDWDWFIICAY